MMSVMRAGGSGGDLLSAHGPLFNSTGPSRGVSLVRLTPWVLVVVLTGLLLLSRQSSPPFGSAAPARADGLTAPALGVLAPQPGKIFVSYSYFEKDPVQVRFRPSRCGRADARRFRGRPDNRC